jgi:hypothetical protein
MCPETVRICKGLQIKFVVCGYYVLLICPGIFSVLVFCSSEKLTALNMRDQAKTLKAIYTEPQL